MLKPIPGYPGYFASEVGKIWSKRPCRRLRDLNPSQPRELKQVINTRGYHQVMLVVNGKRLNRKVARLVLEAFCPTSEAGMLACHGPNGKLDDSLTNLEWGSGKKNQADRKRDGTDCSGARHPMAMLTPEKVEMIRTLKGSVAQSEIGRMFGISQRSVSRIHLGQSWRDK